MRFSLEHVKKTYHVWGRYPFLYKLACVVTFIGQERKLRRASVQTLELHPGDTVLDLACGTGLNFAFLENSVGENGKIFAFDYSQDMLEAAKQRAIKHGWKNITFIQGDAAQLSLDRQVDGVLSTLGISAIPEHKKALQKAAQILKDGKRISILDAKLSSGLWKVFNPIIAEIYTHWASWDYTKKIPEDLAEIFSDVEIKYYNSGTLYIATGTKSESS